MKIPYKSPLIGNIRQALTGLQGYDSMALELIQNADDGEARTIIFDIRDNGLYVENDAPFSSCGMRGPDCPWESDGDPKGRLRACDFHAISMVGSGNKYGESSLIGRFGIGFVSVYQITDNPIIRSGTTQLMLDPASGENSVERIAEVDGSSFELPWVTNEKSRTREALYASAVEHDVCVKMFAALEQTTKSSLLFLKHLQAIEILRQGAPAVGVSLRRKDSYLTVSYEPDGNQKSWYLIEADAAQKADTLKDKFHALKRLRRQTEQQIAFPLDGSPDIEGLLYAYLPTLQSTLLPCHINADFFPEQDRRSIVLSGEQGERYWNEMLLEVAAETITDNLSELRTVLAPENLWSFITAAFEARDQPAFDVFWKALSSKAPGSDIVWTSDERWVKPSSAKIPPRETSSEDENALTRIGLDLVHDCVRRHWNALQSLGGGRLTISDLIEALEIWQEVQRDSDIAGGADAIERYIQPLWATMERLLPSESEAIGGNEEFFQRLGKIQFIPNWEGDLLAPSELYRAPSSLTNEQIEKHVLGTPLVSEKIKAYPKLWELMDELDIVELASFLAERIGDGESAKKELGTESGRLKQFYRFLAEYPRQEEQDQPTAHVLRDVPFLRGASGFLKPREAVFPGGFHDPIGKFEILDAAAFDSRGEEFVSDVLGVQKLTFQNYVLEYLPRLLTDGISRAQYTSLIEEIIDHRDLLQNEEVASALKESPLVLTEAGTFTTPDQAYFRTDDLTLLLGTEPDVWVDRTALPTGQHEYAQALFENLGMTQTPPAAHIVKRIEEIVTDDPTDQARELVQRLFIFLAQQFQKWEEEESVDLEELENLRYISWLPASQNGEADRENWHEPSELYQPFRSAGFLSQVAVLDLRGVRNNPGSAKLLDFLDMPPEPDTDAVVDHLLHCMNSGEAANDTIYQILFQRLSNEDDIPAIDQLKDQTCIFDPATSRYLKPKQVFWSLPHLGQFGFQATPRMGAQRELFEHLGVQNEPDHEAYAEVLIEIAENFGRKSEPVSTSIRAIHELCTIKLSEFVADDPNAADPILDRLEKTPFLLTNDGTLAFSHEIAVCDSNWLAEPFGEDLLSRLVDPVPELRHLYQRLGIKLLSQVVEIEPDRLNELHHLDEISSLLHERTDLLLWLLGNLPRGKIHEMRDILNSVELISTDDIQIRSKFLLDDPEIVSSPRTAMSFYNRDDRRLYVHENSGPSFWSNAFKALLNTLLSGDEVGDLRNLIFIAASVAKASSLADAQEELEEAGFAPPLEERRDLVDLEGSEMGEFEETEQDRSAEAAGMPEVDKETSTDGRTTKGGNKGESAKSGQTSVGGNGKSSTGAGATEPSAGKGETDVSSGSNELNKARARNQSDAAGRKRTEWMRSYVVPKGQESEHERGSRDSDDIIWQIDEAAMRAVLEYEEGRQWKPERKPHNNPGFDILSLSPTGNEKRLIEVKGVRDEWSERGVKMSRTQFDNAEYFGDEFWLYVVEFALEDKKRRVFAIKNPAFKASEFWFDKGWKEVAEEEGGDRRSRFVIGRRINVSDFGNGLIVDVQHRGVIRDLIIEFDSNGKKAIQFNIDRMTLLED